VYAALRYSTPEHRREMASEKEEMAAEKNKVLIYIYIYT
jgi:hypothetical protein